MERKEAAGHLCSRPEKKSPKQTQRPYENLKVLDELEKVGRNLNGIDIVANHFQSECSQSNADQIAPFSADPITSTAVRESVKCPNNARAPEEDEIPEGLPK